VPLDRDFHVSLDASAEERAKSAPDVRLDGQPHVPRYSFDLHAQQVRAVADGVEDAVEIVPFHSVTRLGKGVLQGNRCATRQDAGGPPATRCPESQVEFDVLLQ
jgi:hypothetical protein